MPRHTNDEVCDLICTYVHVVLEFMSMFILMFIVHGVGVHSHSYPLSMLCLFSYACLCLSVW